MDIEKFIFCQYKDEYLVSKKFKREIIDNYNLSERQASDLFAKINNYQINKYGSRLENSKNIEVYTREELLRKSQYARASKGQRKHKYYENVKVNKL